NLELYGDVLIRQNNLKDAIKYYQLAYNQVQNEEILFKLVGVYMLKSFENELLELLKDFKVRMYLGEFEDTQNIASCINNLDASL
ncbi:hypothetical protein VWO27_10175, partial [Campylobacter coli]|nr:hypothetical protein [Campylobacter coli]